MTHRCHCVARIVKSEVFSSNNLKPKLFTSNNQQFVISPVVSVKLLRVLLEKESEHLHPSTFGFISNRSVRESRSFIKIEISPPIVFQDEELLSTVLFMT